MRTPLLFSCNLWGLLKTNDCGLVVEYYVNAKQYIVGLKYVPGNLPTTLIWIQVPWPDRSVLCVLFASSEIDLVPAIGFFHIDLTGDVYNDDDVDGTWFCPMTTWLPDDDGGSKEGLARLRRVVLNAIANPGWVTVHECGVMTLHHRVKLNGILFELVCSVKGMTMNTIELIDAGVPP